MDAKTIKGHLYFLFGAAHENCARLHMDGDLGAAKFGEQIEEAKPIVEAAIDELSTLRAERERKDKALEALIHTAEYLWNEMPIVAAHTPAKVTHPVIEEAKAALAHRGPEGEG